MEVSNGFSLIMQQGCPVDRRVVVVAVEGGGSRSMPAIVAFALDVVEELPVLGFSMAVFWNEPEAAVPARCQAPPLDRVIGGESAWGWGDRQ